MSHSPKTYRAPYGFVVRERRDTPWILWQSWRHWRFGKRCPELINFRDFKPPHNNKVREVRE